MGAPTICWWRAAPLDLLLRALLDWRQCSRGAWASMAHATWSMLSKQAEDTQGYIADNRNALIHHLRPPPTLYTCECKYRMTVLSCNKMQHNQEVQEGSCVQHFGHTAWMSDIRDQTHSTTHAQLKQAQACGRNCMGLMYGRLLMYVEGYIPDQESGPRCLIFSNDNSRRTKARRQVSPACRQHTNMWLQCVQHWCTTGMLTHCPHCRPPHPYPTHKHAHMQLLSSFNLLNVAPA